MNVEPYDPWEDLPPVDEEAALLEHTGPDAKSAGDPQLFRPNEIDDPSLTPQDDTTGGDDGDEEPPEEPTP
jgi:hypothetical protein